MKDVTTTNLADFGYREIQMTRDLLNAWVKHDLPREFCREGVGVMFNRNSGEVFLTNEEFQVCMALDGELFMFYYCNECGHEGFIEDFGSDSVCAGCRDVYENYGKKETV